MKVVVKFDYTLSKSDLKNLWWLAEYFPNIEPLVLVGSEEYSHLSKLKFPAMHALEHPTSDRNIWHSLHKLCRASNGNTIIVKGNNKTLENMKSGFKLRNFLSNSSERLYLASLKDNGMDLEVVEN